MTGRSTFQGLEVFTIASGDGASRASFVPELGAVGSSLIVSGPNGPVELLHQHPFFWDRNTKETRGGSPFCFPICGRLNLEGRSAYELDGVVRDMRIHGFALNLPWVVVDAEPSRVRFRLDDNASTREVYPFRFELEMEHRISNGELVSEFTCLNQSERAMPYYAGFHPYLTTPPAGAGKEQTLVDFVSVRQLIYNENLTKVVGSREPSGFPIPVSVPKVNEMLNRLGDNRLMKLIRPDGIEIHLLAEGLSRPDLISYVQMYTIPDRPFFCIEPWMGYPNMLNEPSNVPWLAPGEMDRGRLTIRSFSPSTK